MCRDQTCFLHTDTPTYDDLPTFEQIAETMKKRFKFSLEVIAHVVKARTRHQSRRCEVHRS